MTRNDRLRRVRIWLALFIAGLVLSGVTAFPVPPEVRCLDHLLHNASLQPIAQSAGLLPFVDRVDEALDVTGLQYPFLAYGTDWLAFAHLVIAIAFLGPLADPVRNKWVVTFGLIACAAVLPLALIAGDIRGIPIAWRLVDCSFGVVGCIPLLFCRAQLRALERMLPNNDER